MQTRVSSRPNNRIAGDCARPLSLAAGKTAPGFRDPSKLERPLVSTMSQTPSLLETIDTMLARNKVPSIGGRWIDLKKDEDSTPVDRASLESWRNHIDDPIWSRTLAAIQIYIPRATYVWIVAKALLANRMAEGARAGVDFVYEQRQKERREYLDLADKAEALAKYFSQQDEEAAACYAESLLPVRKLVELHLREARLLRRHASDEPKPTVPMIRQNRRRGQSGLRVRHAFIHLIAKEVDWWIRAKAAVGFNRIEAIVAFIRIKFPEVNAEVVRKTLEPTTRKGRHEWRADAQKRYRAKVAV